MNIISKIHKYYNLGQNHIFIYAYLNSYLIREITFVGN